MKEFEIFNSKPRHVMCIDDTNAQYGFKDEGASYLATGMIYHATSVEVHDDYTVVQLNEFVTLQFNSMHFAELEYDDNVSEFNILDPRMRHVACINNDDCNWSLRDNASKYLKENEIYHLLDVEVHNWHTRVRLLEFPDLQFSSSHFAEILRPGDEAF